MRYLVIFRSHHEEPADIHYVDVRDAGSPLHAIVEAKVNAPPSHPWVVVRSIRWPHKFNSVDEIVQKATGTFR